MKIKTAALAVSILACISQTAASGSPLVQPTPSYTLVGPLNNPSDIHTNIRPPVLTFNPPSQTITNGSGAQAGTVSGSLLVNIIPPPQNQSVNQGAQVTTGGVLVNDKNSAGFDGGVAYGQASVTQYVAVIPKSPNAPTNVQVPFTVDVTGTAEIQAAQEPSYQDATGKTFYFLSQDATASIDFEIAGNDLHTEAHTPGGYDGESSYDQPATFNGNGPLPVMGTPNAWIPIILTATISSSGVFSGSELAKIDPTLTIDPAFASDYELELTPLDIPEVSTVPEVEPLVLVGGFCLFGLALQAQLKARRARG